MDNKATTNPLFTFHSKSLVSVLATFRFFFIHASIFPKKIIFLGIVLKKWMRLRFLIPAFFKKPPLWYFPWLNLTFLFDNRLFFWSLNFFIFIFLNSTFQISLMMMMAKMLYTFENLFSIFWNRMIYEKWIEWSNSKDFCVKCQDFLQSKHYVSILLCIYYPKKLPISLKTFIRYECSHLVSLPSQTSHYQLW